MKKRLSTREVKKVLPGLKIVCSIGCGKTTDSIKDPADPGEFYELDHSPVPEWTCPDCVKFIGEITEIFSKLIAWNFQSLAAPGEKGLSWDEAARAMIKLFKQHSD